MRICNSQVLLYFRNIRRRFNEEAISVKGCWYKKITRFYGWTRCELWSCGGKSKVRKLIKTNDARRYRRFTKRELKKDV